MKTRFLAGLVIAAAAVIAVVLLIGMEKDGDSGPDPGDRDPGVVVAKGNSVDKAADGRDDGGASARDRDRDGHSGIAENGDDCDDSNPSIFPGAPEIPCNNVDENCSGMADDAPDADSDTYDICDPSDPGDKDGKKADCDDTNKAVHPGANEVCDCIDNQCPPEAGYGEVDEGCPCVDNDKDSFFCQTKCAKGAPLDCDDNSADRWSSCSSCLDNDQDGYFLKCDAYSRIKGPDCDDANANAWDTCATCRDNDQDTYYEACNNYAGINGPDCNDSDIDNWASCKTCLDRDKDTWYIGCDAYTKRKGPDCNDGNANTGDSCDTCNDGDGDGYFQLCNQYTDIKGPDCNDAQPNAWDTCDTCKDSDQDTYYGVCNKYSGIKGVDCNDNDVDNWASCETCLDGDSDAWYVDCDAYTTRNGPDCDDWNKKANKECKGCADNDGDGHEAGGACADPTDCDDDNAEVYPGAEEICDCADNQCPGDEGYGKVDEGCPQGIPMELNFPNLSICGKDRGVFDLNGHQVMLKVGDTACRQIETDRTQCRIQVTNLDPDEYMANTFININYCEECSSARFDSADLVGDKVVHNGPASGDPGGSVPLETASPEQPVRNCVVENGNFLMKNFHNVNGCPTHQISPADPNLHKPRQIIAPGATKSNLWIFSGRSSTYQFVTSITAEYYPWGDPGTNPRYDLGHRSTFYVMVTDLSDQMTADNKSWYRLGSFKRSKILSGWNATGSNVMKPLPSDQKYFGVNVAVEYPDRIESYRMGDGSLNQNYEYYTQFSFLLRYDPEVVEMISGRGGRAAKTPSGTILRTGLLDICAGAGECQKGKDTFRQYSAPGAGSFSGYGFIGTMEVMKSGQGNELFTQMETATYQTVSGGNINISGAVKGYGCAGHHGVARWNVALDNCTENMENCILQDGPDAEPEMPLAMWYMKLLSDPTGTASEFWIDMFSGYTSFTLGWTNGTLVPSGLGVGNDDFLNYCYDPAGAGVPEQPCPADTPTRIIHNSLERTNPDIDQGGRFIAPHNPVDPGAFQQWPAHIVVQ